MGLNWTGEHEHKVADTPFGFFRVWGDATWAGPGYQRGHEANYCKPGNAKKCAQALYEEFLSDALEQSEGPSWKDIGTAPKTGGDDDYSGPWVLGIDSSDEQRVMRWTTEYPCDKGVWMFAYTPTDYIDGIQTFRPVAWMVLPKGLKGG